MDITHAPQQWAEFGEEFGVSHLVYQIRLNASTGSHHLFYHQNTLYSVFALTDETGAIAEG
jgi:hypothetical protein